MEIRRFVYRIEQRAWSKVHYILSEYKNIEYYLYEHHKDVMAIIDTPIHIANSVSQRVHINHQPLERIFELDQRVAYTPEEGQLKSNIDSKKRYLSQLHLKQDPQLLIEYKRIHDIGMVWPQVTANMKSMGVLDMELYLDGYSAFLMMDVPLNFDNEEKGKLWSTLPREQEWQEYVAKYQNIDPTTSVQDKWIPLYEYLL